MEFLIILTAIFALCAIACLFACLKINEDENEADEVVKSLEVDKPTDDGRTK